MLKKFCYHQLFNKIKLIQLPMYSLSNKHTIQDNKQQFKNIKSIINKIDHNLHNITIKQFDIYLDAILQSIHTLTINQNFISLIKYLKQQPINDLPLEIIEKLCAIVPLVISSQGPPVSLIQSLRMRIQKQIESEQKLSNECLIRFMNLLHQTYEYQLLSKTLSILKQRIHNLQLKNIPKYLDFIIKRKLPNLQQKTIFSIFITNLINNIQKYQRKTNIKIYNKIIKINKKIYQIHNLDNTLHHHIKKSIHLMDHKEILKLIDDKSGNHPFNHIVFYHILNTIDQNGDSYISNKTILKLLCKLTTSQKTTLSHPKLQKFIYKNLQHQKLITELITNKFFTHQQLQKLNNKIFQQFSQLYLQNYIYIYYMLTYNIITYNHIKNILNNFENKCAYANFNDKFLLSALITSELARIQPNNQFVINLHQHFIDVISRQVMNLTFKSPLVANNIELLYYFNIKYGQYFVPYFYQRCLQNNIYDMSLFNYLFCIRDTQKLQTLITSNKKYLINLKHWICKIFNNPNKFIQFYQFINNIMIQNHHSLYYIIKYYINNWDIHHLLNYSHIQSFLTLATIIIKHQNNTFVSWNITTYFIHTPNPQIKSHPKYLPLLKQFENKIISNQAKFTLKSNIIQSLSSELIYYNQISQPFAYIIINTPKINDKFLYYAKSVLKQNIIFHQIQTFEKYHTYTLLRSNNISQQQLEKNLPKLRKSYQNFPIKDLIGTLLNFNLPQTKISILIYQQIIQQLKIKLQTQKINSYKFNYIIYWLLTNKKYNKQYIIHLIYFSINAIQYYINKITIHQFIHLVDFIYKTQISFNHKKLFQQLLTQMNNTQFFQTQDKELLQRATDLFCIGPEQQRIMFLTELIKNKKNVCYLMNNMSILNMNDANMTQFCQELNKANNDCDQFQAYIQSKQQQDQLLDKMNQVLLQDNRQLESIMIKEYRVLHINHQYFVIVNRVKSYSFESQLKEFITNQLTNKTLTIQKQNIHIVFINNFDPQLFNHSILKQFLYLQNVLKLLQNHKQNQQLTTIPQKNTLI